MYDGWTGAASENQRDGTLVFGGYDAANTTGPNVTIGSIRSPAMPITMNGT